MKAPRYSVGERVLLQTSYESINGVYEVLGIGTEADGYLGMTVSGVPFAYDIGLSLDDSGVPTLFDEPFLKKIQEPGEFADWASLKAHLNSGDPMPAPRGQLPDGEYRMGFSIDPDADK